MSWVNYRSFSLPDYRSHALYTTIKLSCHAGRESAARVGWYPHHRDVNVTYHPWPLGSGNPCRNDDTVLTFLSFPRRSVGTINVNSPSWGLSAPRQSVLMVFLVPTLDLF